MQCYQKETTAPRGMARGSAATDGRFAFFSPWDSTTVYQYEMSSEKWRELPSCPYFDSGLVVVGGELCAVGGWRFPRFSNKLLTLHLGAWEQQYPPMNTARAFPAVVTTSDGEYLIAIGGSLGINWRPAVELFHVKCKLWYKLTDLPQPLPRPSTTIHGNIIHVIGINKSGYSCSLQALPSSREEPPTPLSWRHLPCLPLTQSTAATLCGQLVIVGGVKNGPLCNSIYMLVDKEWMEVGCMASNRKWCLLVSSSPDRLIILGGWGEMKSIEECVLV